MELVIGVSCCSTVFVLVFVLLFFFFSFLFLSDIINFSWSWEKRLRPSSVDGKKRIAGFDPTVLMSPAVPSFWEYWNKNCSERRERSKWHSLHGHATSCGQQMNRRIGSSSGWAKKQVTDNDDEGMRWSLSLGPREREAIGLSVVAHNLSIFYLPGPPLLKKTEKIWKA